MKTENIVLYFPKNFFLIEAINNEIGFIKSSGLIDFWINKYADHRFLNYKEQKKGPQKLSLKHLSGTFVVFLTGCLASAVAFVMENLIKLVEKCKVVEN